MEGVCREQAMFCCLLGLDLLRKDEEVEQEPNALEEVEINLGLTHVLVEGVVEEAMVVYS